MTLLFAGVEAPKKIKVRSPSYQRHFAKRTLKYLFGHTGSASKSLNYHRHACPFCKSHKLLNVQINASSVSLPFISSRGMFMKSPESLQEALPVAKPTV